MHQILNQNLAGAAEAVKLFSLIHKGKEISLLATNMYSVMDVCSDVDPH